jgi:hypothetical protein
MTPGTKVQCERSHWLGYVAHLEDRYVEAVKQHAPHALIAFLDGTAQWVPLHQLEALDAVDEPSG